ncbi:UDP-glycosyltransferase 79B30-like [Neltuma alba]|uniref:UDP-glycosyltransferase 79B30-like n=1 Tax=Neltuma alba TaxID=207710 RepID=UPI0010A42EFA|nr:UDP-glycosyltransferase 79B30-like [Prosopis alba]
MEEPRMHIAMYLWLAIGHITPCIQLSNKLAKRGHRISIFIPTRTQSKLQHLNLYPHLISFIPITVPHVEGLPHGAETTSDVDPSHHPILMTAMDRTKKQVEDLLIQLKPNIVFFDFTHWLPDLARRLGIKSVQYFVAGLVAKAFLTCREITKGLAARNINPSAFPDLSIRLHMHEEKYIEKLRGFEFGSGVRFVDRLEWGAESSDAVAFKNCREMEGPFVDYLEKVSRRRILLSGPVIPEPQTSTTLELKWDRWLAGFKHGSVIYCAFGSEFKLELSQFQELILGLELSGMPFLVAVKPPKGYESIEASLPEGFEERVRGRGIVHGGWVQQQLILKHSSVGCFVTHCGSGSMLEALLSHCQLVLLPAIFDQIINARMISDRFKAGVEVKKGEEDGLFTKESVCEAVRSVMNKESEIAKEIRANHANLRNILLSNNFESSYIDNFCHQLQDLLK